VLFDPGFTVIDATIAPSQGLFFMIFKDERFGDVFGEHRALRVAMSDQLDGEYTVLTEAITPVITEGPTVMPVPHRDEWYLYYDFCMDDRYGLSRSTDLTRWDPVEGADFPPNARHGSICPVTNEELDRLTSVWQSTAEGE
jgi:hypothetical protein